MTEKYLCWIREYMEEIYKTPILENFLDLKIADISEGKITYKMEVIDRHCNIYGFVHGGTLASISDVAMGVSCLTMGKRVVTIDMSISYIKNTPAGSTLTAVGEVISNGKTIMHAACEIFCGDQLLVKTQASYFVIGEIGENDYPPQK